MNIVEIAREFLPSWMPLWVLPLAPVLTGVLVTFWTKIKALYERLSTYLVSVIKLDADLSAEFLSHLGTEARISTLGAKGYIVLSRFVRSKRKQTWILARWLDKKGDMTFWYPWRGVRVPVWVSRGEDSTYVAFRFFRGTVPAQELLERFVAESNNRKDGRYRLHRVSGTAEHKSDGRPQAVAYATGSSFTSKSATSYLLTESPTDIGEPNHTGGPADLWLPDSLSLILEDARQWFRNRDWYLEHRLPWRRGYLLYGNPGTGKTSLARAIGIDLGIPIYVVDLQSMTNNDLTRAFDTIREDAPCIFLVEDIDAVYNARTAQRANTQLGTPPSFDLLLNQIQGVGSNDGVLVIITTNYLATIDRALGGPAEQLPDGTISIGDIYPRPGRIDRLCRTPDTIDEVGRRFLAARTLPPGISVESVLAGSEGMTAAQFQELLLTRAQEVL